MIGPWFRAGLRAGPRAAVVTAVVVAPSLILVDAPGGAPSGGMALLAGAAAGLFTWHDYAARSPALVELRDAPPYNRARFLLFAASLLTAAVALGGPGPLADLLAVVGLLLAKLLDLPGSPLRMVPLEGWTPEAARAFRIAFGLAFACAGAGAVWTARALGRDGWPGRVAGANLWVNLPTVDAAEDGLIARLRRDAAVNLGLGIAAPYLVPSAAIALGLPPLAGADAIVVVWVVTLWAVIPACLILRGLALRRLAAVLAARPVPEGPLSSPA